jgi:DNA-binding response OmpR family regulator
MARVKAVLCRRESAEAGKPKTLQYEGLVIDLSHKSVKVDGEAVALTKTEFELLVLLLSHRGKVFSRQQILDSVWPQDVIVTDRTVDVNVTRMRKKIGRYAHLIVSRQGFGYVFEL